jgi:hypothetical protein
VWALELLLLGLAGSVFFHLRAQRQRGSQRGWASSQGSAVVSCPRSGLVSNAGVVLEYWTTGPVEQFGGEGDGLALAPGRCAAPNWGEGEGEPARCSWVRVAGDVRLGGGLPRRKK